MKSKDIMMMLVAAVIFIAIGVVLYGQLKPKRTSGAHQTTVEVVDPINSSFDSSALSSINNPAQVRDFAVSIDLNGLGNPTPFGR